jgi:signal transduction histidine kinase
LQFAYWQPLLHVSLETAASLFAVLAGLLVFSRFRRFSRLNELLLAYALATLALLNLFFLNVPALVDLMPHDVVVWAELAGSALGALLFALAALAPPRPLPHSGGLLAGGIAGLAAAVVLTAVVSELVERSPPHAASPLPAGPPTQPDLPAQPSVLALQLAMTVLYGVAAAGFLRRSQRFDDEFLGWLSAAAVLGTAAHLNYFLHLPLHSQSVHIGDAFRLCFYVVLLAGSIREIWSYWSARSAAAVLEERRRIARDLHDGLAQELVYLARNLDSLDPPDGDTSGDAVARLRRAVARAQFESRRAVSALTAPAGQTAETALAHAARETAERLGVGLDLDLVPGVRLPTARAEALVRIACEAITNAAQHSGSARVRLGLESDGSLVRLRVSDRGCGFDATAAGGGFGLVSMRERAHSVGGELHISSAAEQGSEVEVSLWL